MPIGEKYAKFPLETDQIEANFEDNLADIPTLHRPHFERLYKKDLQVVESSYHQLIEILKKNSGERIQNNKNYQNLLKEISKKDAFGDPVEIFGQTDLQLDETINIMKELIYFFEKPASQKAA